MHVNHTGIKFRHNLWTWMDPQCWIFTSFSWGGSHHYCLGQVKQGVGSHPLWIRTGCGHFSSLAPRGILTRWTWHYTVLSLIWNLGRIRFKNNWTFNIFFGWLTPWKLAWDPIRFSTPRAPLSRAFFMSLSIPGIEISPNTWIVYSEIKTKYNVYEKKRHIKKRMVCGLKCKLR